MKKVFVILLIVLFVVSFIGTGFFLFSKSQKPTEVYETETPIFTDIIKKTVATGSITPRKEIALKSQVSGIVDELFVEPGDYSKKGQLIARIRIIPDVVALNNAEMRLKAALINFKNNERELQRQKKLFDEKVIAEFDYNNFQLQYNLARQEVEAAENNLELVKEGASKKAGSSSNLVYATAEGMILDVPVEQGDFVIESNTFNEGTTIASVADMDDLIFKGKVDESEVGKIQPGMELLLKIGALEKEEITALLEFISPKGVEEEGAIQFEIKANIVTKSDAFLRAGYSANADIVLEKRDSTMAINEGNLIIEGNKTFVEVETAPQTFEKVEIKTGLSDGINIEVTEGITANSKVKKQTK